MSARTAIIIQARTGSSRLPGKVLADIAGRPLLAHVIERAKACRMADIVAVATTALAEDDAVADLVLGLGVAAYRGSENDLLDRYFQAAKALGAEIVVRYTADDPFKDPGLTDKVASALLADPGLDYACNFNPPTWPEGLDVEVLRLSALERAWREAKEPYEREHVNPYILEHPELFRTLNVESGRDLSGCRLTVDYPADLELARAVYGRLYKGRIFPFSDVERLMDAEPELFGINRGIERGLGLKLSRAQGGAP